MRGSKDILKTDILKHISKHERVARAEHVNGCDFLLTDRGCWYAKKTGLNKYTSYISPSIEKERFALFGGGDIDNIIKMRLRESLDHYENNWGVQ